MSPIPLIQLQRRLSEAGRIRMGEKTEKGAPKRLNTWRITSPDDNLVRQAAGLYGGKPRPWDSPTGPQFEVVTETSELPVLVLAAYSLSQQYEYRTSPTLVERRCDGEHLDDGYKCLCAQEPGDDKCDLITRLTVALPELTTLLGWRLESKGENAARELLGSLELAQAVAQGRPLVSAKLRIVERRGNVKGQPVRYGVPVLDFSVSYQQIAQSLAAPEGHQTLKRPVQQIGVGEGLASVAEAKPRPERANSAAPIPEQDAPLGPAAVPVDEGPPFTEGPSTPFSEGPPFTVPTDVHERLVKRPPKASAQQKKKLDVLVGDLRDRQKKLATQHLYTAVALMREQKGGDPHVDGAAIAVNLDAINEEGRVRWSPLRDDLTRDEAASLIDRLERFAGHIDR